MTRASWIPRRISRQRCAHCRLRIFHEGATHDYFMVRHKLWREHGVGPALLSLSCFERVLGRRLTLRDLLPKAPINEAARAFIRERAAAHKPEAIL